MTLHNNAELFKDAITATAQQMKIAEIYVEKDYWVTLALKTIFASEIGKEAVFKGGTALSKCYKLIERFSEDIDLVVLRREAETDSQLKTKIRDLSKLVGTVMPEIEVEGITRKMGMNRKTAHTYAKGEFKGELGQIREHIVVEATWLGNFEPYTNAEVISFIAEMMRSNGQEELITEYGLEPFTVRVLTKERTICEKIMSLVRFSYTDQPYEDLANKIRHIYDIHMLLKDPLVAIFFDSDEFDKMLNTVGKDDILTYKNNNDWLSSPPQKAIVYAEPEKTWDAIRQPYRTTFKDLVTGVLPEEEEMIITLKQVSERLKKVSWDVC
ncbi:nucleotidyl transferase AbiEii/AbiGii toxin family protein [Mucilaginibacter sp.]|uniref:nucleotidyl transferase AbiEii/AbiGii toxin family protein n=1 Tax=Mucilaginibacter sp. TaxID=1882438 RepID=UPI0035BBE972